MKLNWFSPLPPARTEIAQHTARILPALSRQAEVTLWTEQREWDRGLEKYAEVRSFDPENLPWGELNHADMTFYNIGNNAEFHLQIWQVSQKYRGVVILHDTRLQHFFAWIYRYLLGDEARYLDQLERYYGPQSRHDGECWWHGERTLEYMIENYPMTPWALDGALGAFVHTRQAVDEVRKTDCRPIGYSKLPYPCTQGTEYPQHRSALYRKPPYRLIIFGYIETNRRLEPFLEALAAMPERQRFGLQIFGALWDTAYVQQKIETLGLQKLVTIRGFVPEPELDSALSQAHLAINLRYPTMGEASASQLRIWSHALPTLVTKVGMYADLPASAVAFVRPDHEIDDIQHHLRAFLANPGRFAQMGKSGLETLAAEHSPDVYARSITDFARQVSGTRLHKTACELADLAGQTISPWNADATAEIGMRHVAERIHELLC
jgi:glycosyltransferase involved in cell wall biosynthesis